MRRPIQTIQWAVGLLACFVFSQQCVAQSAANGRTLYNSILVSGNPSCGSGGCHGPNPDLNINGVKNGDTPGGIAFAIARVRQMAFLQNRLTNDQIADLSAYIANPAAANGPAISVSESSVDFGSVTVGQAAPSRNLTISNSGNATLNITSISVSNAEFSATGSGCAQVAAGGSCTLVTGFTPQSVGGKSATVTLNHNASGGSSTVALSGSGSSLQQASVALSSNTLSFGRAFVGQRLETQSLILTNLGPTRLTFGSINGQLSHFIVVDNGCTSTRPFDPGESCSLQIAFLPSASTPITESLSVFHDGVGQSSTVTLSGNGVTLPVGTRMMVEYHIPSLDYYFITSKVDEQNILDGIATFRRTGFAFPVFAETAEGRSGLSRYFFPEVARNAQRGSHFYTVLESEKLLLASLNPTNESVRGKGVNEGVDSYAALPIAGVFGPSCAAGLQPVLRIFRGNQRFPDDPNHRFTIVRSIYDTFVSRGWDGEGVMFCVPAP